jgi:hypothetical protein
MSSSTQVRTRQDDNLASQDKQDKEDDEYDHDDTTTDIHNLIVAIGACSQTWGERDLARLPNSRTDVVKGLLAAGGPFTPTRGGVPKGSDKMGGRCLNDEAPWAARDQE